MNSVKTKKGTVLPLMNLKGKPYMQVAHRIVWFNEDTEGGSFSIETEHLELNSERAVIKSTVKVFDKDGKLLKQGVGTKAESKKDFGDFIEKAETGAIGRAITMLGYGTAYALADLDEGERIIDSPVVNVKAVSPAPQVNSAVSVQSKESESAAASTSVKSEASSAPKKKAMFQKPGSDNQQPIAKAAVSDDADAWN